MSDSRRYFCLSCEDWAEGCWHALQAAHDFWCQVAICAVLQRFKTVSDKMAEVYVTRLDYLPIMDNDIFMLFNFPEFETA